MLPAHAIERRLTWWSNYELISTTREIDVPMGRAGKRLVGPCSPILKTSPTAPPVLSRPHHSGRAVGGSRTSESNVTRLAYLRSITLLR